MSVELLRAKKAGLLLLVVLRQLHHPLLASLDEFLESGSLPVLPFHILPECVCCRALNQQDELAHLHHQRHEKLSKAAIHQAVQ